MRALRPDWSPSGLSGQERPDRTVSVVASWHGTTLHLWGWDGRHSVAPTWFAGAFDGADDPFRLGRLAVLDVELPQGERLRPVTLRLNPDRVAPWLRALEESTVPGESLAWFVAVNRLAAATVAAGQLTPVVSRGARPPAGPLEAGHRRHPRRRLFRPRRGRAADLPGR